MPYASSSFAPSIGVAGLFIHTEAGKFTVNGSTTSIAAASTALTANATNYVYIAPATATIAVSTSAFPAYSVPICTAVTGVSSVTSLTDNRPDLLVLNSGATLAGATTFSGAVTASSTLDVTGAVTMGSTLGVTSDLTIGSSKMTVAAATGNTVVAGTLQVTGALTQTGAAALNGGETVPTAKTVSITDADALTVGSKIVPQTLVVPVMPMIITPPQKGNAFVAHRALKVISIKEIHSATAAGVTIALRKITDTSAPDAAAGATVKELLSSSLAADSTADTTVTASLSATPADYTFAAGDRLCWSASAALTSYQGAIIVNFQAV